MHCLYIILVIVVWMKMGNFTPRAEFEPTVLANFEDQHAKNQHLDSLISSFSPSLPGQNRLLQLLIHGFIFKHTCTYLYSAIVAKVNELLSNQTGRGWHNRQSASFQHGRFGVEIPVE